MRSVFHIDILTYLTATSWTSAKTFLFFTENQCIPRV